MTPQDADFTLANLPFGIFSTDTNLDARAGIAVGDRILDLSALSETGCFDFDGEVLRRPVLNDFIALGKPTTSRARTQVQQWLGNIANSPVQDAHFTDRRSARMHLPIRIGDYTDFYSSIEHATNVGRLFRDPENALLPNWRHLPIGYHGRASSIVVSGTPVRRPYGQILSEGSDRPQYLPSARLDFELEMAFVVGKDSELGRPVLIGEAEDYIFGMLLFNDWSARDIQSYEYRPLGPFLGKSFASSVSPWIVPFEALEAFRVAGPEQQPAPLDYLCTRGPAHFDIGLSVELNNEQIARTNFRHLYWSMAQQLAHHTSNGCNLRVGDLLASGTISGREAGTLGSLLEITENGRKGKFLQDGDTVRMRAHAGSGDRRVGFGEVVATIAPAGERPT